MCVLYPCAVPLRCTLALYPYGVPLRCTLTVYHCVVILPLRFTLTLYPYVAGGVLHGHLPVRGALHPSDQRGHSARGLRRHPLLPRPQVGETPRSDREYNFKINK